MSLIRGKMPAVWQAKWIDPELKHDKKQRQPSSVLRRAFTAKAAEDAVLYITCHGLYTACLNGERVGDFVLAPGVDDYKKRLQVQAYDVSALLREGENELTVTLGDGWYRGNNGIDGSHNLSGDDLALLCQLEADGEVLLCSDESWEASQEGPVRRNDMELGEVYDARMEEIAGWHGVRAKNYGFAKLVPTGSVPIREKERFEGKLFTTPNGETVIDFGQNLAGYTELRVTAKAGQTLTLWHGETLDENGNFTQSNYDPGTRNKNGGIPQKLTYICKDGLNVWKPQFCIFGFRYAKLETDVDLSDAVFTSIAVYSDMAQTGFFECGNADVNRLYENSLWSMRSNFCDIPTDCPTRERAGWTGDAAAFAPTAVYLMDCYPVLRKWLAECRLAQGKDGKIANIAPANNVTGIIGRIIKGSAGWGDACVIVPWVLYETYGDKTILEENYDMMRRWLAFCEKRAKKTRRENRKNPYRSYLVDTGFHFGEWLEPDVSSMDAMRQNMTKGSPEVATAYYYRSASLLSKIAAILGKDGDAEKYAQIAEGAKKAYRLALTKDGAIESERQCAYVRPVAFGLLEGNEAKAAADALDALVQKNAYHLNTGFLSTPFLCSVLADHGHTDTAYKLLLQDTCPSWLYAVKKGATTIWETWDGVREDGTVHDSLNHYSYGAITGWLFSGVCGIRFSEGKLEICPKPDLSLRFAKAEWRSPVGTIKSAWRYEDDRLIFDFSSPIPATVELPNGESFTIEAGEAHHEVLL
ncbi:MAG: family 78 glycoside hydrolase catalytic domain [Oscillospiraceae bacterium]|nr:family 78 glycoside hydrolase catalytic domain [Oscillospiraceae bacterium]